MDIVGNGFLAHRLSAALGERHPRVTAIAAGVSSTSVRDAAAFEREATLVMKVLIRAREIGHRVVFFSTSSAAFYGAPGCGGSEQETPVPTSPYGRHKLDLEELVRSSGVPSVILRVSHLVGPGQREHQLLPALVTAIRAGRVELHEGAHRDLLDVGDLCVVLDALLRRGEQNLLVNACTGIPQPIPAVVDGIESRLGLVAERVVVPATPVQVAASTARLRALVPEVADLGFGPGYLDRLLDRYVPRVRVPSSSPASPSPASDPVTVPDPAPADRRPTGIVR